MRFKKLFTVLFLVLISIFAYTQEEAVQTYYKDYKITFNFQDQLVDAIEASALKAGEFYFVAKKKGEQLLSIGYYDHAGNIQTYLLDRFYNIYFNYMTFEYKNEQVISKKFRDTKDFVLSKIDYEYDVNKKISKTILWNYSLTLRKMIKLEETNYTYTAENYDVVERFNRREQTYEKIVYRGTPSVQEYERYDIDGKTLQYKIKFYYEGEKLAKKEYYSKSNVLLKTEISKPTTNTEA